MVKTICGKESCAMCESCKFDLPLDTPFRKLKNSNHMKNFGVMPLDGNPSTAQIIMLGGNTQKNSIPPFSNSHDDTKILFPTNGKKEKPLCNGCDFLKKIQRPGQATFNCRCMLNMFGPTVTERVIKLKVYPDEKVEAPCWCKKLEHQNKSAAVLALPSIANSALSDEQRKCWDTIKESNRLRELWKGASGIMAWCDIEVGKTYHLPPSIKKPRMDIYVEKKYPSSIYAKNIKTNDNVWLYKEDEDYKFLSETK